MTKHFPKSVTLPCTFRFPTFTPLPTCSDTLFLFSLPLPFLPSSMPLFLYFASLCLLFLSGETFASTLSSPHSLKQWPWANDGIVNPPPYVYSFIFCLFLSYHFLLYVSPLFYFKKSK